MLADQIILIGSSRLLHACANIIDEFYAGERSITVLDFSDGGVVARLAYGGED